MIRYTAAFAFIFAMVVSILRGGFELPDGTWYVLHVPAGNPAVITIGGVEYRSGTHPVFVPHQASLIFEAGNEVWNRCGRWHCVNETSQMPVIIPAPTH